MACDQHGCTPNSASSEVLQSKGVYNGSGSLAGIIWEDIPQKQTSPSSALSGDLAKSAIQQRSDGRLSDKQQLRAN